MDIIKSQINQCEARIKQYEDSNLHTPAEKMNLIAKEKEALEKLYIKQADTIIVNNPETLS
jgi:hypothetical protein